MRKIYLCILMFSAIGIVSAQTNNYSLLNQLIDWDSQFNFDQLKKMCDSRGWELTRDAGHFTGEGHYSYNKIVKKTNEVIFQGIICNNYSIVFKDNKIKSLTINLNEITKESYLDTLEKLKKILGDKQSINDQFDQNSVCFNWDKEKFGFYLTSKYYPNKSNPKTFFLKIESTIL